MTHYTSQYGFDKPYKPFKPAPLARRPMRTGDYYANLNPKRTPDVDMLLAMHQYMRPAGSQSEAAFVARFLAPLADHANVTSYTRDLKGNVIIRVGADSRAMWSSHTDTVHYDSGQQSLAWADGWLVVNDRVPAAEDQPEPKPQPPNCLGADCTAGVWLMVQMITAPVPVPGLYIFHAEEETGGGGSRYISAKTPEVLSGIDYAIAFDRRGYKSVVTHQFGSRCCSEGFATALAERLGLIDGNAYAPDDGGTFTDTANYTHLVPECTNISVGYFDQHSSSESLDLWFLLALRDRLCSPDFTAETLPALRDPNEWDDHHYAPRKRELRNSMEDLVWDHPDIAAELLEAMGITEQDFMDVVEKRGILR